MQVCLSVILPAACHPACTHAGALLSDTGCLLEASEALNNVSSELICLSNVISLPPCRQQIGDEEMKGSEMIESSSHVEGGLMFSKVRVSMWVFVRGWQMLCGRSVLWTYQSPNAPHIPAKPQVPPRPLKVTTALHFEAIKNFSRIIAFAILIKLSFLRQERYFETLSGFHSMCCLDVGDGSLMSISADLGRVSSSCATVFSPPTSSARDPDPETGNESQGNSLKIVLAFSHPPFPIISASPPLPSGCLALSNCEAHRSETGMKERQPKTEWGRHTSLKRCRLKQTHLQRFKFIHFLCEGKMMNSSEWSQPSGEESQLKDWSQGPARWKGSITF